jgi:hypothetical protein
MIGLNDTVKTILTISGGLALACGFYVYFNAIDFTKNTEGIPLPTPLTIAVFVIWLAAILTLNQIGELKTIDFKTQLNPIKVWGAMFKGTPKWVLALAIASFIFGIVNLALLISDVGVTGIIDGKYVVHNHGQIIRELTKQEFILSKSKELKGITAMHIFFLGMGTAILYPRKEIRLAATNAQQKL